MRKGVKPRLLLSMTWSRRKPCSTQRHSSHLTHQSCAQHELRSALKSTEKRINCHWEVLDALNPALNLGIYLLSEAISKQKEQRSHFGPSECSAVISCWVLLSKLLIPQGCVVTRSIKRIITHSVQKIFICYL